MSYETILFDVREQVATVTLDRPDVRNAFGAGMGPELDDAFRRCDEDDDIRAVVLTGTPPAFCSGADLVRGGETFGKVDTSTFNAAGLRFPPWDVRKPVIGAINGHCVGGGLEIALACDLRIARTNAGKVGLPEVSLGVLPGTGGTQRLGRAVGRAKAIELMAEAATFGVEEAKALGLVNAVSMHPRASSVRGRWSTRASASRRRKRRARSGSSSAR